MLSESPAFIRRILRFLALPLCYYSFIHGKECNVQKLRVIYDLLYIFFRLKYFPENYSLCHLWEKERSEWKHYYGSVYDALQRSLLRKEVFPIKYRILFDDKNVCHQLCQANHLPVPVQFNIVDTYEFKDILHRLVMNHPQKKFILKPLTGRGGKNIFLACSHENQIFIKGNNKQKIPIKNFVLPEKSVIQEFIRQHPKLEEISRSVNTVRIVTILSHSHEVFIIGAFMRFGVEDSFLDNTSQGGVTVGINIETGKLDSEAHDFQSRVYELHPTSGFHFKDFQVPLWDEIVKLAQKTQRSFSQNKIIGQDIAVTENGPVIIELNAEYDNIGLEQVCGPILKNHRVLQTFNDYGLLFNKEQRLLLHNMPENID